MATDKPPEIKPPHEEHVHGPGCAHGHGHEAGEEYDPRLHDPNYLLGRQPVYRTEPKVGRNDPCPCGSGKKYKKCHGA